MSALDPDLVRQLLADGAASIDVWHIDRTETGDGAANVIASCPGTVDQVRASADLAELVPDLAADWLRLRDEIARLRALLDSMSRSAFSDEEAATAATQASYWEGCAEAYEHASGLVAALADPTPCPEENPTL